MGRQILCIGSYGTSVRTTKTQDREAFVEKVTKDLQCLSFSHEGYLGFVERQLSMAFIWGRASRWLSGWLLYPKACMTKTWIIDPLMFKEKVIMLFLASLFQAQKHAFSDNVISPSHIPCNCVFEIGENGFCPGVCWFWKSLWWSSGSAYWWSLLCNSKHAFYISILSTSHIFLYQYVDLCACVCSSGCLKYGLGYLNN